MVYVALLRGINVGGNRKVDMKQLKDVFEHAGMISVRTYINSGNVIFSTTRRAAGRLPTLLEAAIGDRFGFEVPVLIRDTDRMKSTVRAIPRRWTSDAAIRCDVMFLWEDIDRPSILGELPVKPGIDDVRYAPGAVIWSMERKNVTRSGMAKVVGTPIYRKMTIRNSNTTRKLLELMSG